MLFRCVVDDEIHYELHVTLLDFFDEIVDIRQGSIAGVDIFVVSDIVAHVRLWALVNGR